MKTMVPVEAIFPPAKQTVVLGQLMLVRFAVVPDV
jgi:hypothetical protein